LINKFFGEFLVLATGNWIKTEYNSENSKIFESTVEKTLQFLHIFTTTNMQMCWCLDLRNMQLPGLHSFNISFEYG